MNFGQLPVPDICQHDLIFATLNLDTPKNIKKTVTYRDFKNVNWDALKINAYNINWNPLFCANEIDDKIEYLNNKLTELYDKFVPFKTISVKNPPAPWLTPAIKDMMKQRDRIKRYHRQYRRLEDWHRYKTLRNRTRQEIRNAKLRYYHSLLNNPENKNEIWSNCRKFRFIPPKKEMASKIPHDLNMLNNFFLSSPSLNSVNRNLNIQSAVNYYNLNRDQEKPQFNFTPVTSDDILEGIKHVSQASKGSDGLSAKMILNIFEAVSLVLLHIFNFSLGQGSFPSKWKEAIIRPIPKVTNPTDLKHFRPISLLCTLSKVLEFLVQRQISSFLHINNLFDTYQSGFRPGHSTCTALIKVSDDIRKAMDERKVTVLCLIDFSKAFDSIIHPVFLAKLNFMNFSETSIKWFSSYLSDRKQRIIISQKEMSDWAFLVDGTPQGSSLSPLIFTIYLLEVSKNFIFSSYHIFADDLQIYIHTEVDNIEESMIKLNQDISRLETWCAEHGLIINPKKTQSMLIGYHKLLKRVDKNALPKIKVMNEEIDFIDVARNLGVYFNSTLTWSDHVLQVARKVNGILYQLNRRKHLIPTGVRITLFKSLILPIIDYCGPVYCDITAVLAHKLQVVFNNCIRFIFDLRYDDHVSDHIKSIKLMKLNVRREYMITCMVFKTLHDGSPGYLAGEFNSLREVHGRTTRQGHNLLQIPRHRTDMYNKSFLVSAIRAWNLLPIDIKAKCSVGAFREALWTFLFNK